MGEKHDIGTRSHTAGRRSVQEQTLGQTEPELRRLASEGKKDEFFGRIVPLLQRLKSFIERRLRIAHLSEEIRTPVATSEDILDDVVLKAYQSGIREKAAGFNSGSIAIPDREQNVGSISRQTTENRETQRKS